MDEIQREIKYRLRLHNTKKMMDWNEVNNTISLALYQHRKGEATLLQYTGLNDKNGKDIYEGDIVLGKFDIDTIEDYMYLGLSGFEMMNQEKKFVIYDIFYPYTNPLPDDIEVIGNIYENPGLLSD